MDLVQTLKVLLGVQILMFGWTMQITYAASHDGVDSMAGLAAVFPLGIFSLLGLVNFVLFLIFLVRVVSKKIPMDMVALGLAAVTVILVIFYDTLEGLARSGSV